MDDRPTQLYLYAEPAAPTLNLEELAQWVKQHLPRLPVALRRPFIEHHLADLSPPGREGGLERLAQGFAQAKVRDPSRPKVPFEPLPGEVNYERRRLSQPQRGTFGLLYDGEELMALLRDLIPAEESGLGHVHVVFTNQLFGTCDEDDLRYHARVCILGFPSLLSTTGIVEAPAKPREYYLLKQRYSMLRMGDAAALALEPRFKGRVIEMNDERLTEVMKGYVMQAIFYHLSAEPFCTDPNCRLFNAHWQEEVVRAQLGGVEFCAEHGRQLSALNRGP